MNSVSFNVSIIPKIILYDKKDAWGYPVKELKDSEMLQYKLDYLCFYLQSFITIVEVLIKSYLLVRKKRKTKLFNN